MSQNNHRIRVASLQYFIRPVTTFEQFQDQVASLVETAQDYGCRLLVFPEYFTCQLLTLGNIKRPISDQIRDLANQGDRFVKMMQGLAREWKIYIVAGTIPVLQKETGKIFNESYFFNPQGNYGVQGKIHMTRFETEDWFVSSQSRFKVFETEFGKVAITICYDVEFPELARAAARYGAYILIVPSCTDDRQSYLRVRYCAQARAIENQMFVIHSPTVGSLPMVPAVSLNYGQASILTPSDFVFSRDGILAEGVPNQESMVLGELDLRVIKEAREQGTVLPLRDSQGTNEVVRELEVVSL